MRKVIVRASTEREALADITRQQLATLKAKRMPREAYVWLYWGQPVAEQVMAAAKLVKPYGVKRLWLDCEDAVIWSPAEMVEKVREAVAACTLPVGIYTRRQWWQLHMADSEEFADLPLWDCQADGNLMMDTFVLYGGWREASMKQYNLDQQIVGRSVDLNTYRM